MDIKGTKWNNSTQVAFGKQQLTRDRQQIDMDTERDIENKKEYMHAKNAKLALNEEQPMYM